MEQMYAKSVTVEKQCVACKVAAGFGFSAYGMYHGARFYDLWRHYRVREKVFNLFAVSVIFTLALLNFNAAYEIKMGKELTPIELRPSYSQRFRDLYRINSISKADLESMTDEQREQHYNFLLQQEEER